MALSDDQFADLINALNDALTRQKLFEERLARIERTLFQPAAQPQVAVEPVLADPVPATEIPDLEAAQAAGLSPEAGESVASVSTIDPIQATEPSPALETKVGLTLLNRIGVVTLVLGVGFFFKWAVDNNWVGPAGRVALGLIAGFATLALADVLWRKGQQIFAQGITGAGIAIIYISLYAAFDFYQLIPQSVAFVLMFVTTGMSVTLALRYNAITIAALSLFGAYLIPLLLSNGEDHPWFLLSYLLLINFASRELTVRRGWRVLELLSFAATVFIFGGWLINHGGRTEDRFVAAIGAIALCGQRFRTSWPILFLCSQVLTALAGNIIWHGSQNFVWFSLLAAMGGLAFAHIRRYTPSAYAVFSAFWLSSFIWSSEIPSRVDFMLLGSLGFLMFYGWIWWRHAFLRETPSAGTLSIFSLNGVVYYALAYSVLQHDFHHWLGLLAVTVAATYLAFGMFIHRKAESADSEMMLLALGVSVAFLTLAIPVQLSGFSVTMAWSIEASALTWIGTRLRSYRSVIAALVVFGLAFLRIAIVDSVMYPDFHSYSLLLNLRFLVFLVLSLGLLLSAYWSSKLDERFARIYFIAGHLVMLSGLSLEVIGWADRSTRPEDLLSVETIGITILFAIYAVILVSVGVATRSKVGRMSGLTLTGIVILKLYLFDVWQLSRVYQIVAFVILGALLLSTSFLYSRFKGLIDQWRKDEKTAL